MEELYHIHLKENYDYKWQVGKSIIIPNNFDSTMNKRYNNFTQKILILDGNNPQYNSIYNQLAALFFKLDSVNKIDKDMFEELKNTLKITFDLTYRADFFKRETSLENCRKDYYLKRPSRLHSLFLCDKDGLEYWEDIIGNNKTKKYSIYKVLTNNVFKTNEQLLPNEFNTYEEAYNNAHKYWKPKFDDVENSCNEYLAQGEIKILEKIKEV